MALRMQTNPVLVHLTRHSRWPSIRLTVGLTLGLGVVYSYLAAHAVHGWPTTLVDIFGVIVSLGDLFLMVAPLLAGLMTVIMTVRFIRSDAYTTLCTTSLASGVIARGLILSALYRVHLLLVLVFILSAGEMAYSISFGRLIVSGLINPPCYVFMSPDEFHEVELAGGRSYYGHRDLCVAPSDSRLALLDSLPELELPVMLWGVTLLAVVGCVAVSLTWRRKLWGVLFSLAMMAATMLIDFNRYGIVGTLYARLSPRNDPVLALAVVWPPLILLSRFFVEAAIPYVLVLSIVWLTSRLARKSV